MVPNNKDNDRDSALSVQVGGDHYKNFKIQPFDFIYYNNIPFTEGCIIKYICRYEKKGTPIEDLKKIKHYVDMLIEKKKENLNDIPQRNMYKDPIDWGNYLHNKLYGMGQARQDPANYQRCSNDD